MYYERTYIFLSLIELKKRDVGFRNVSLIDLMFFFIVLYYSIYIHSIFDQYCCDKNQKIRGLLYKQKDFRKLLISE